MIFKIEGDIEKEIEVGNFVETSLALHPSIKMFEVIELIDASSVKIKSEEQEICLSAVFIFAVWRKI
jgi:hypothetical protein